MVETERERDLTDYTQRTTLANLFRLTAPTDGKPLNEWLLAEIAERDNDPEKRRYPVNAKRCCSVLPTAARKQARTFWHR